MNELEDDWNAWASEDIYRYPDTLLILSDSILFRVTSSEQASISPSFILKLDSDSTQYWLHKSIFSRYIRINPGFHSLSVIRNEKTEWSCILYSINELPLYFRFSFFDSLKNYYTQTADLDIFLINDLDDTCNYRHPRRLWGDSTSKYDDPMYKTSSTAEESIDIIQTSPGLYRLFVHNYYDSTSLRSNTDSVLPYYRLTMGNQYITVAPPRKLGPNDLWNVGTVRMPECIFTKFDFIINKLYP
jgi:hypothetical protein